MLDGVLVELSKPSVVIISGDSSTSQRLKLHAATGENVARFSPEHGRWYGYLDKLVTDDATYAAARARIAAFEKLFGRAKGCILAPAITTPGDEGVISLAWNFENEILELEFSPNGITWFYRDRVADKAEGDGVPMEALSERALGLLARFAVWGTATR